MASLLGAVRDLSASAADSTWSSSGTASASRGLQRLGFGTGKRSRSLPAVTDGGPREGPPSPRRASARFRSAAVDEAVGAVEEAVPASETARGEDEGCKRISLPERVRLVAMDLGPTFVKLGQIASTRTDILPSAWISELKKLQDEVSPLPLRPDQGRFVEESLGRSLGEVYERFDEKPLAAASIGQVHRAVLRRGDGVEDVVVKVRSGPARAPRWRATSRSSTRWPRW